MVKRQDLDNVIMAMLAIVGVSLLGVCLSAFKNIHSTCTDILIRDGWTVIMVLGACLTTAAISFFLCTMSEGASCYADPEQSLALFLGLCIILAGIILILSALMLSHYKKENVSTNCDDNGNNKKLAGITLGLSLITFIGCAVVLAKTY